MGSSTASRSRRLLSDWSRASGIKPAAREKREGTYVLTSTAVQKGMFGAMCSEETKVHGSLTLRLERAHVSARRNLGKRLEASWSSNRPVHVPLYRRLASRSGCVTGQSAAARLFTSFLRYIRTALKTRTPPFSLAPARID